MVYAYLVIIKVSALKGTVPICFSHSKKKTHNTVVSIFLSENDLFLLPCNTAAGGDQKQLDTAM